MRAHFTIGVNIFSKIVANWLLKKEVVTYVGVSSINIAILALFTYFLVKKRGEKR